MKAESTESGIAFRVGGQKGLFPRCSQVSESITPELFGFHGQPGIPNETPRLRLVDREIMSDGWLVP
jgi:hypothetical protein